MRFLADESCDFVTVRGLRAAGHEVLSVAEAAPSAGDANILRLALAEERILLTEGKDFGEFLFAHAGMAGRTGMLVGLWHAHCPHVPIPCATFLRKRIDPDGWVWRGVIQATGQPARM